LYFHFFVGADGEQGGLVWGQPGRICFDSTHYIWGLSCFQATTGSVPKEKGRLAHGAKKRLEKRSIGRVKAAMRRQA
jgi:hypothetical protein